MTKKIATKLVFGKIDMVGNEVIPDSSKSFNIFIKINVTLSDVHTQIFRVERNLFEDS